MTLKSYKSDPCAQNLKCMCVYVCACRWERGFGCLMTLPVSTISYDRKASYSLPSLSFSLDASLLSLSDSLHFQPLLERFPTSAHFTKPLDSSKLIFKLYYFSLYYVCICKFILETVVLVCYSLSLWFQTKAYNFKASSSWIDIV